MGNTTLVTETIDVLSRLADGDLTARIAVEGIGSEDGELSARLNAVIDELAESFEKLETTTDNSKRLKQRYIEQIISSRDDERRRIARELHDETGQQIGSIVAGLFGLERELEDEALKKRARDLRHLASTTLRELRRISHGLHSAVLDTLGLTAALERQAEEFSALRGISVKTQFVGIDSGNRLPVAVETTLYRVLQEALTNAAKHAKPTEISVVISRLKNQVRLFIEDDGVGMPRRFNRLAPGESADPRGLGLVGIEERVALLGGTVRIDWARSEGTALVVEIPLNPDEQ